MPPSITVDTLAVLAEQQQVLASRGPAKLNEAKVLLTTIRHEALTPLGNGYDGQWADANYAGVAQKWLLHTSEQARERELHTLKNNLLKSTETSFKQFQRLCQQLFSCEAGALAALAAVAKELTYVDILESACEAIQVFAGKGRRTRRTGT